jgi:AcrR family transcriptional regulator
MVSSPLFGDSPAAKHAIMTEALKLFASRGVEAVSVRDIAAASGFTNPALFRHFASKDALARALFEACYLRLAAAMQAAAAKAGMAAWLEAALGEIVAAPEMVHFVFENVRRYWAALPDEARACNLPALTRAMLARAQATGAVRGDLDLSLAATVVLGALGQIARSAHFREAELRPSVLAEQLSTLLMQGFAAP